MRLLQLSTSPDEVLDLHPNVSIVTGLDAGGRGLLIDAVERLARAEAVSATGLLEAHGVLFDLDPDLLSLIEATESVDPVVRAAQLPTQPVSLDARELRSREDAFAVLLELISGQAEKQSTARATLAAAQAALERAHAARAAAVSSSQRRDEDLEAQARRLEELADERRLVRRRLEEASGELEQVRGRQLEVAQRAQAIRAAHDAAAALRAEIEAELARLDAAPAEPASEPGAFEPIVPESADLAPVASEAVATSLDPADTARIEQLEQLLLAIAPVERTSVEHALAALVAGATDDGQPSANALRLADELDQVAGDLARLAPDGDGASSLADARVRLDEARHALLEAEQAVRIPALDRDDVLKLEDIHGELIDAIEKSDGRFGRARAGARVTELRAAEQEVLDRLGFTSYSAYMMGYSLNDTDPAKEAELDRARAELAAAEDAWAMLAGSLEDEAEQVAALDRRRELLREAESVLGREVTSAPQAELRALRVRTTTGHDAASELRAALEVVGIDLAGEELDHDELVLIGRTWLAEADEATERRRIALDELAVLRGGGPVHVEPVDVEPVDVEPVDVEPVDVEPVDVESVDVGLRGLELARDLATARDMEQSAADTLVGTEEEVAAVASEVGRLEAAAGRLTEELTALDAAVSEVEDALSGLTEVVDLSMLDMQLESAKAVHAEAQAAMEVTDQAMATLDAEGRAEAQEIERLQDIVGAQGTENATPAEELEWYLLARLAAQRSVSIAGSVPLLLDDALSGLGIEEACHLLTRLERMADVVQVIVVSDDPIVATWAMTTGPTRAAVVSPGAV